jgi:anti-sigma-K factor RskA
MSGSDAHLDRESCGGNAAPYVLGALTDNEAEAFRRHMDACSICRDEVSALRAVGGALPAAAPQLTAPSDLKRRVMSTVEAEAQRRRSTSPARPTRQSALRAPRWRAAFAVGFAALAVAVGAVALSSSGTGASRVIRAQAPPRASALLRLTDGHAELTIARMPQSPPGHVYEVWLKGAGGPLPTDALFTVTSSGDASVNVPGNLHGINEVLVTAEPLGGSRVPTRAPVIVARLGERIS